MQQTYEVEWHDGTIYEVEAAAGTDPQAIVDAIQEFVDSQPPPAPEPEETSIWQDVKDWGTGVAAGGRAHFARAIGGAVDAVAEGMDRKPPAVGPMSFRGAASDLPEEYTTDTRDAVAPFVGKLEGIAQREEMVADVLRPESFGGQVAYDAATAIEQMLPSIVTFWLTKNPNISLGVMGAGVAPSAYSKAKSEGATHEEATSYAVRQTLYEVGPEKMWGVFDKLGAGKILKQLIRTAGLEAGSEVTTEAMNIVDEWITEGSPGGAKEIMGRLSYAGLLGGILGVGMAAPGAAFRQQEINRAEDLDKVLSSAPDGQQPLDLRQDLHEDIDQGRAVSEEEAWEEMWSYSPENEALAAEYEPVVMAQEEENVELRRKELENLIKSRGPERLRELLDMRNNPELADAFNALPQKEQDLINSFGDRAASILSEWAENKADQGPLYGEVEDILGQRSEEILRADDETVLRQYGELVEDVENDPLVKRYELEKTGVRMLGPDNKPMTPAIEAMRDLVLEETVGAIEEAQESGELPAPRFTTDQLDDLTLASEAADRIGSNLSGDTVITATARHNARHFAPSGVTYKKGSQWRWEVEGVDRGKGRVYASRNHYNKDGEIDGWVKWWWDVKRPGDPRHQMKGGRLDIQMPPGSTANPEQRAATWMKEINRKAVAFIRHGVKGRSDYIFGSPTQEEYENSLYEQYVQEERARKGVKESAPRAKASEIRGALSTLVMEDPAKWLPKNVEIDIDAPGLYKAVDNTGAPVISSKLLRAAQSKASGGKRRISDADALGQETLDRLRERARNVASGTQAWAVERLIIAMKTDTRAGPPVPWRKAPKIKQDSAGSEVVTYIGRTAAQRIGQGTAQRERAYQVLVDGSLRVLEVVPTEVGRQYAVRVVSTGATTYPKPGIEIGRVGKAFSKQQAEKLFEETQRDTIEAAIAVVASQQAKMGEPAQEETGVGTEVTPEEAAITTPDGFIDYKEIKRLRRKRTRAKKKKGRLTPAEAELLELAEAQELDDTNEIESVAGDVTEADKAALAFQNRGEYDRVLAEEREGTYEIDPADTLQDEQAALEREYQAEEELFWREQQRKQVVRRNARRMAAQRGWGRDKLNQQESKRLAQALIVDMGMYTDPTKEGGANVSEPAPNSVGARLAEYVEHTKPIAEMQPEEFREQVLRGLKAAFPQEVEKVEDLSEIGRKRRNSALVDAAMDVLSPYFRNTTTGAELGVEERARQGRSKSTYTGDTPNFLRGTGITLTAVGREQQRASGRLLRDLLKQHPNISHADYHMVVEALKQTLIKFDPDIGLGPKKWRQRNLRDVTGALDWVPVEGKPGFWKLEWDWGVTRNTSKSPLVFKEVYQDWVGNQADIADFSAEELRATYGEVTKNIKQPKYYDKSVGGLPIWALDMARGVVESSWPGGEQKRGGRSLSPGQEATEVGGLSGEAALRDRERRGRMQEREGRIPEPELDRLRKGEESLHDRRLKELGTQPVPEGEGLPAESTAAANMIYSESTLEVAQSLANEPSISSLEAALGATEAATARVIESVKEDVDTARKEPVKESKARESEVTDDRAARVAAELRKDIRSDQRKDRFRWTKEARSRERELLKKLEARYDKKLDEKLGEASNRINEQGIVTLRTELDALRARADETHELVEAGLRERAVSEVKAELDKIRERRERRRNNRDIIYDLSTELSMQTAAEKLDKPAKPGKVAGVEALENIEQPQATEETLEEAATVKKQAKEALEGVTYDNKKRAQAAADTVSMEEDASDSDTKVFSTARTVVGMNRWIAKLKRNFGTSTKGPLKRSRLLTKSKKAKSMPKEGADLIVSEWWKLQGKIQESVEKSRRAWALARKELRKAGWKRFNDEQSKALNAYLQGVKVEDIASTYGFTIPESALPHLDEWMRQAAALSHAGQENAAFVGQPLLAKIINGRAYLHAMAKRTWRTKLAATDIAEKYLGSINYDVLTDKAMESLVMPTTPEALHTKYFRNIKDYLTPGNKAWSVWNERYDGRTITNGILYERQPADPDGNVYYRAWYVSSDNQRVDLGLSKDTKSISWTEATKIHGKQADLKDALVKAMSVDMPTRADVKELVKKQIRDMVEPTALGVRAKASRALGMGKDISIALKREVLLSDADLIDLMLNYMSHSVSGTDIKKQIAADKKAFTARKKIPSVPEFIKEMRTKYAGDDKVLKVLDRAETTVELNALMRRAINEVHDTESRMANTIEKLARTVYISDYLSTIVNAGQQNGWASVASTQRTGSTQGWTTLAPQGTPLGDSTFILPGPNSKEIAASEVSVPNEVAEAVAMFFGINSAVETAFFNKGFRKLSSLSKYGKVVLSPLAHPRNLVSTTTIHLSRNLGGLNYFYAHGIGLSMSRHQAVSSLSAYKEEQTQAKKSARVLRLEEAITKRGLSFDGGRSGAMYDLHHYGFGLEAQGTATMHQIQAASKRILEIHDEMFRLEDEAVKYPAFIMQTSEWLWMHGHDYQLVNRYLDGDKLSASETKLLDEAMDAGAERVKQLYPTFSRTAPWVKSLSRFPLVGSFPSFTYEVMRTTVNGALYGVEMASRGMLAQAGKIDGISKAQGAAMTSLGIWKFITSVSLGLLAPGAEALLAYLLYEWWDDDDDKDAAAKEALEREATNSLLAVQLGTSDYQRVVDPINPDWMGNGMHYIKNIDPETGDMEVGSIDYVAPMGSWNVALLGLAKNLRKAVLEQRPYLAIHAGKAIAQSWTDLFGNDEVVFGTLIQRMRRGADAEKWEYEGQSTAEQWGNRVQSLIQGDDSGAFNWALAAAAGTVVEEAPGMEYVRAAVGAYDFFKQALGYEEGMYSEMEFNDLVLNRVMHIGGLKSREVTFKGDVARKVKKLQQKVAEETELFKTELIKTRFESYDEFRDAFDALDINRREYMEEISRALITSNRLLGRSWKEIDTALSAAGVYKTFGGNITRADLVRGYYAPPEPKDMGAEILKWMSDDLAEAYGIDPSKQRTRKTSPYAFKLEDKEYVDKLFGWYDKAWADEGYSRVYEQPTVPKTEKKPAPRRAAPKQDLNLQVKMDLMGHEGFRSAVYEDPLDPKDKTKWTVGFGHKLNSEERLKWSPGTRITKEEAERLFEKDVKYAITQTGKLPVNFDSQPPDVQRALVNMVYQMGYAGVSKFKNTLRLIKERRYEEAADEALRSAWAKQTPSRAREVADMIRSAGGD